MARGLSGQLAASGSKNTLEFRKTEVSVLLQTMWLGDTLEEDAGAAEEQN